jgi:hypothetical protein
MPPGILGPPAAFFQNWLGCRIRVLRRFSVEFAARNCTLFPEISRIAGAVEEVDNVVLLVWLTWLAYVSEQKSRQVFDALEIVFGVFFGVEALGGFN